MVEKINMEDVPEMWGIHDNDVIPLQFDFHEAVIYYLDGIGGKLKDLPETIEVVGYRRKEVTKRDLYYMNSPLEQIIEYLDDEWGDPDGEFDQSGWKEMSAAEDQFLQVIIDNYVPWACEEIPETKETVNVQEWIKENVPEWIQQEEDEEKKIAEEKQEQG